MPTIPNRYLPGDYTGPQRRVPVGYGRRHNPFYSEAAYRAAHGGRNPPAAPNPPQQANANKTPRQQLIQSTVKNVAKALRDAQTGLSGADARQYARVILTRPGVKLGRGGAIFLDGKKYSPKDFASSPIARLATGLTAQRKNQAALEGSPDYINALASLGLQRDQSISGLQDQQRQALIQYGDPTFVQGDATTAAAASANPFSTAALQRQAYNQQAQQATATANRYGTLFGGGEISGQQQAQKAYAANVQDAVSKIQQLLGQIQGQQAAAGQAYGIGKSQAAQDAYNALLASGYHAAVAPKWSVGTFALKGYGKPGAGGGQGFQWPTPTWQAGGGGGLPSQPRPGLPGAPLGSTGGHMPPATQPIQQPNIDMNALLRRYGIGG